MLSDGISEFKICKYMGINKNDLKMLLSNSYRNFTRTFKGKLKILFIVHIILISREYHKIFAKLYCKSLFGYFVLIAVIICMAAVCIHEHISDYGLNSLIWSLEQGVFDVSLLSVLL